MIVSCKQMVFIVIILVHCFQVNLFSYYGYLPDTMRFYDAITIRAHNAQSVSGLGWNIPNHYGSFYDLMKLYGARNIDLRVYLGTDEVAALAPAADVIHWFGNLFTGKPLNQPREKPRALITCHEHDNYYQNCYFTRLLMKRGIPTKIDYFLHEIERFLQNNPREFLVVTFGMYMDAIQGNDVNGWKGKTQAEVTAFFDAIIERSGLAKRVVGIPGQNTTIAELRGKVVLLGDFSGVVGKSKYVKHFVSDMFKTQGWSQFPESLQKGICPLYFKNPYAPALEVNIIPTNPFDTGMSVDAINAFLKFVTGGEDFKIYDFKTQVNTEQNMRNMINICKRVHNHQVHAIGMDFISKGSPVLPADVIFRINQERLKEKGLVSQYASYQAYIVTLK